MRNRVPYTGQRSSLAVIKNNERLRNMKLLQLISDNFTADDYFITFHYSKHQRCGSAAAIVLFKKYIRQLRSLYSDKNKTLLYVKTTRTGKRGGITHYMILNADVPKESITQLWTYSAIPPVVKRFGSCDNAELLTAFSVADNEVFKKAYTGSHNLCRSI